MESYRILNSGKCFLLPAAGKAICLLVMLSPFLLNAGQEANPFSSYNQKIEYYEKRLERTEDEKKREELQAKIDEIKDQRSRELDKRKEPFVKKLESYKAHLGKAVSGAKKRSLQNRIDEMQRKIDRLDAYAGGASKFDVNVDEIEKRKERDKEKKGDETDEEGDK
ncbi:MAG: hypothetical protein JW808_10930 [Victivallales bacterium]|nr:hypothetical protein [Victivallales bacterium]